MCKTFTAILTGHFSKHREMTTLLHKTITHLTFSPDGTELLVNMGGEQIYLYDINGARPAVVSANQHS